MAYLNGRYLYPILIALAASVGLAAGFFSPSNPVAFADSCEPSGSSLPLYGSNPVHTSNCPGGNGGIIGGGINKTYSDAEDAALCGITNPSLAIEVIATACPAYAAIRIRISGWKNSVLVFDRTGSASYTASVTSPCLSECEWPDTWAWDILGGTAGSVDINVYCCSGDCSAPC